MSKKKKIVGIQNFGTIEILPNEVSLYKKNIDQFIANKYNTTIESVHEYRKFIEDRRCISFTKKGNRCLMGCHSVNFVDFIYGYSNVCGIHKNSGITK